MPLPDSLAKVTTICSGRYLVDIPEAFTPTAATYAQFYYGLDKNFRTVDLSIPASSLIRIAGASSYAKSASSAGRGACLGPIVVDAAQTPRYCTPRSRARNIPMS